MSSVVIYIDFQNICGMNETHLTKCWRILFPEINSFNEWKSLNSKLVGQICVYDSVCQIKIISIANQYR